jgi:hypothetical protein
VLEWSDFFLGIVITRSLACGTSSGLGSKIISEFRAFLTKHFYDFFDMAELAM